MSFGFGVGDIITCTQMAVKTIDALRSAGSDFEGLRLELSSLTSILSSLKAEADGPIALINNANPERQEQMRSLLGNCTASMKDLQSLVMKYRSWNSDKRKDFVGWMRFAAKDKKGPREKLAIHTASINIFLTTLGHGSPIPRVAGTRALSYHTIALLLHFLSMRPQGKGATLQSTVPSL